MCWEAFLVIVRVHHLVTDTHIKDRMDRHLGAQPMRGGALDRCHMTTRRHTFSQRFGSVHILMTGT